jgi:threonine dehydrogenase-like Zn-dependent dehydrogenase
MKREEGYARLWTRKTHAIEERPMPERVRAAVMTAPGVIELQDFPYPKVQPGAMLMRMELSGVCGTDKHTYQGETKQYAGTEAESETPFPIIPGHENVGVVAELSEEARRGLEFYGRELREGDRVVMCPDVVCGRCWYCRHTRGYPWCNNVRGYGNAFSTEEAPSLFGGWAEYMYILPEVFVYKVPEDVPPELAVLAEPFAVAFALDEAAQEGALPGGGVGAGDMVVVQGVGPLGLCCLIKARMLGASEIVAVELSDFRLEMARDFSADHTLNAGRTTREERVARVRELSEGRGADMVVGCTGVPESLSEGLEMLRKGGTYLELGNFVDTGAIELNVHRDIVARNARIIGLGNHPYTKYEASLRLLKKYNGQFPFERIITHRYPLAEAEAALRKSMEPDSMKVVIQP